MSTVIKWTVSWLAMVLSIGIMLVRRPLIPQETKEMSNFLKGNLNYLMFLISLYVHITLDENIQTMGQEELNNIQLVITVLFIHTPMRKLLRDRWALNGPKRNFPHNKGTRIWNMGICTQLLLRENRTLSLFKIL